MEILVTLALMVASAYASNRIAKWRGLNERNMTSAGAILGPAAIVFGLIAPKKYANQAPSGDVGGAMIGLLIWIAAVISAILVLT